MQLAVSGDGQILYSQSVRTGLLQFQSQFYCSVQLPVLYNGIESHIDPRPETVGIVTKRLDIFQTVPGSLPCPERRACKINGIGTAVYGRDADFQVSCRSKQFKRPHRTICSMQQSVPLQPLCI